MAQTTTYTCDRPVCKATIPVNDTVYLITTSAYSQTNNSSQNIGTVMLCPTCKALLDAFLTQAS